MTAGALSSIDRRRLPLKCIVGLGNPGRRYAGSRHNIGFETVECFAGQELFEPERRKFKALYQERTLSLKGGAEKVYLVRPQTYMNASGHAVRDFLGFFGVDTTSSLAETLLVVHDDLDLPQGRLRYRVRGSAGGHRGLQSVIECLGHRDFSRLKIGVGRREGSEPAAYVLEKADPQTREALGRAARLAAASLGVWLAEGDEVAMNRFNRPDE